MLTEDNTYEELFSAIEDLLVKGDSAGKYLIGQITKWTERIKKLVNEGVKYKPERISDDGLLSEMTLIGYEVDYGHPEPVVELIKTFVALCNKTMEDSPEVWFEGHDYLIREWENKRRDREIAREIHKNPKLQCIKGADLSLEKKIKRTHPSPYLDIANGGDEIVVKYVKSSKRDNGAYWYYCYVEFEVCVNGTNLYRFSNEFLRDNKESVDIERMFNQLVEDLESGFVATFGGHPCIYLIDKYENGSWVSHRSWNNR